MGLQETAFYGGLPRHLTPSNHDSLWTYSSNQTFMFDQHTGFGSCCDYWFWLWLVVDRLCSHNMNQNPRQLEHMINLWSSKKQLSFCFFGFVRVIFFATKKIQAFASPENSGIRCKPRCWNINSYITGSFCWQMLVNIQSMGPKNGSIIGVHTFGGRQTGNSRDSHP